METFPDSMAGCGLCLSGVLDEEASIGVALGGAEGSVMGVWSGGASGMGLACSPIGHLGGGCVFGGSGAWLVRGAGGTDGCCIRAHTHIPLSHVAWEGVQ